jgi:hypothetical protein
VVSCEDGLALLERQVAELDAGVGKQVVHQHPAGFAPAVGDGDTSAVILGAGVPQPLVAG